MRPAVHARIEGLARALDVRVDAGDRPLDALRRLGVAALHRHLRARALDCPDCDDLPTLIQTAAGAVLEVLEKKLGVENHAGATPIERVRRARRIIHEVRTDPGRQIDHAPAAAWADEAMLAFRIASYSGQYVAPHPTTDRIAETLEKLEEDLYRRIVPPFGERAARVRFQPPIAANDFLAPGARFRDAVAKLTAACEAAVQDGLDAINAKNAHPGAQTWTEPLNQPTPAPATPAA